MFYRLLNIAKLALIISSLGLLPIITVAQGNTCANAVNIGGLPYNTPFLNNPTTCGAGNNYTRTERCGNYYMDDEEYMFAYTPAAGVNCINVQLNAAATNLDVPTALFITKGCPDDPLGECVAQFVNTLNDNAPKPSTLNNVNVTPGETYYIQVTARFDCYEFTLAVTQGNACAPAPTGFDCNAAEVIPAMPFVANNTTCGKSDYFKEGNFCSSTIYWDGPQYVMEYTPTTNECIKVSGRATDQTVRMSVNEGCPTYSSANCNEVDYYYTSFDRTNYYTLTANTTYYFVMSTSSALPGCTGYDLTFSSISSSGSVCSDAIEIDSTFFSLPFQTTRCKGDDYNNGDGCANWYFSDEEVMFKYESKGMECISVSANNLSYYGGLFMLDACPNDPMANCLAFDIGSNWTKPNIGFEYTITNPGTYYFMMGARYTTPVDFDFLFTSSPIDPLGVVCETAHNLPSSTYVYAPGLSTTCKANDYAPASSLCNLDLISGAEYVLTYTAPTTFCGTIVGKNTSGNGGIMLMDACPNSITGSCLGATACEVNCDSIFLDYTFQAGQTYYIVLGAAAGGNLFSCDLEIKKSYNTPDGCVPCDGSNVECAECLNSDFETGTLLRWDGTYGNYNNPEQNGGFVSDYINNPFSRHTVVNAGGYDAVVGPALKTTAPEGARYAIRLGNRSSGYEAETITYRVTVTPDNTMFMYYHAVVLNEPTNIHDPTDQPFFSINMSDGNGDVVGCVEYEVRSSSTDGSFTRTVSALNPNIDILWKDWTLAVVPLDPFLGQTIDITFMTKDCDLGGHFGYAYIDAFCGNIKIEPSNEVLCSGDAIVLEAPVGFKDYLWNTGETTQSITVNTGGTYTVDVAGYGGACSATFTIFVDEFNYPTPDFTNPALVCGDDPAQFTDLSISNDTTDIVTWLWDFGDGANDTLQNPTHQYGKAGIYDVQLIIETSMGCEDTIVKQIKYSNPKLLVDSILHPLCYTDSTGYIKLLTDSGISPYTLTINGLDEGISTFDSLPADIYLFNLTDDYGCATDTAFEIIQPDLLTIDTNITNLRCFKTNDGKIEVVTAGGTAPYLFNLDGLPFQVDSVFDNLEADTFDVIVQDVNLCAKSLEIVVTQPDSLEFTFITNNVDCNGDSTGSIVIAPMGGTDPYTYGVDTLALQSDSLIENLKAINYTLYTIDDSGCLAQMTQLITEPDAIQFTINNITNSSCSQATGTFDVSTMGGMQPYQFQLDGNPFQLDSNFTAVSAGSHTLSVTDANGCGPFTQNFITPSDNAVVITDISSTCDLATSSYQIQVTVTNGDPSTYTVNEIAPLVGGTWISANTWLSNPIGSNVAYDFYFTDVNNCAPARANGVIECECKADAGSFAYNDTVYFCDKNIETFNHNSDHFLESDESLIFILHDGTTLPLGNILDQKSTPTFDLTGLNFNTPYYVLAIAAETSGSTVNFSDICLDYSEQVPFVIYPPLQFTATTTDQLVCPVDSVTINLNTQGQAPFTVDYMVNGINNGVSYSSTNYNITLPIYSQTNVVFTQVDDYFNSPCLLNPNTALVFNVFDSLVVSNVSFTCNNTNTQYQVSFDITGGDAASYTVNGTSSAATFTSGWINNGSPYNFVIDDVNNCNPVTITGNHACNCSTDAGSLDLTPQTACTIDVISITHNSDHTLDGNDALYFVLHNSNSGLGTISAWNNSPSFGFQAGMIAGQTYYITAVAGNDLGTTIDLYDPCLSVVSYTPVLFHDSPQLTVNVPTQICQGDSILISIAASGSFGNYTLNYTVNGNNKSQTLTNGNNSFYETINSNSTITLTDASNSSSPNCINNLGTTYNVIALDAPTAVVSNITCNNTATRYTVTLNITGGDASSYLVNGVASGTQYTSAEIVSGNTYSFVISDVNNCNPQTITGSYTCPCITQLSGFDTTQAFACSFDTVIATAPSNVVLDGNDILAYLTSTSLTPAIGNIIEWLNTPLVNYSSSYNLGNTYYLFAVAGNPSLINLVDLDNNCTQLSNPKPFEFIPMPDVFKDTDLDLCFGDSLNINLYFTGEAPFELNLDYNGTALNLFSSDTIYPLSILPKQGDQISYTTLTSYGKTTCTSVINYTLPIYIADDITATFDIVDLPCHDATTGSISPTIMGGFGMYNNEWQLSGNVVSTDYNLSNAVGGNYTVLVTDQRGCNNNFNATIQTPPPFVIDYVAIINEVCYEDYTGKIYVEAPGSVENELYSATVTATTYDSLFVDLSYAPSTNIYTITATNANGCIADTTIQIEGLTPVDVAFNAPTNILCPDELVTLLASGSGGVGNYTYLWNSSVNDSNFTVQANTETVVTIQVKDGNLCKSPEKEIVLRYYKILETDIMVSDYVVCPGDEVNIEVNPSFGDFNYTFQWRINGTTIADTSNAITINPTSQNDVAVIVTDGCMQTATETSLIDVSSPTLFDITPGETQHYCGSNEAQFQLNITNGSLTNCRWDFGDGATKKVCGNTMNHYYERAGLYDVTFSATDNYGCNYGRILPKAVQINPQSLADFIVAPNIVTDLDNYVEVIDRSMYAENVTWKVNNEPWNHANYLSLDRSLDEYTITQTTTTQYGCNDVMTKVLPIKPVLRVFIPNSFSPNQDGINGLFMPVLYAADPTYFDFRVYDRWGELLFQTQDQTQGWDGTYKGNPVPSSVYSYIVKVRNIEKTKIQPYMGTVTLLR
jgi:gliding motility-associated-like protein